MVGVHGCITIAGIIPEHCVFGTRGTVFVTSTHVIDSMSVEQMNMH